MDRRKKHCYDDFEPFSHGFKVSWLYIENAMKSRKTNIWKGQVDDIVIRRIHAPRSSIPDGPDVAGRVRSAREVLYDVRHRSTIRKLRKQRCNGATNELAGAVLAVKPLSG